MMVVRMEIERLLFFFNDTATTEIYTLSLHDALPIWCGGATAATPRAGDGVRHRRGHGPADRLHATARRGTRPGADRDRKSTRLNSSHANISYAVFCLKKKKHILLHTLQQPDSKRCSP